MKRTVFAILGGIILAACAAGGPSRVAEEAEAVEKGPSLRIMPDPVRFEDTVIGCARSVTLQIENPNLEAPITVVSATLPNSALALSDELPVTLPPGGSQSLELRFAPVTSGDWSGAIRFSVEGDGTRSFPSSAMATATKPAFDALDLARLAPLDLVFVLDVSTTMYEIARLRAALQDLFALVEAHALDVRFGLVTFVNDVNVHRGGSFLDRAAFLEALDSQLVAESWIPNPALPRQLLNFDLPENSLDALHRAATAFDFRPGARRYLFLMTDDTFLEPPEVFSDRTPALYSYTEVASELNEGDLRLFVVQDGAHGAGFSTGYEGAPSLVALTGGAWFEISEVSNGSLSLGELLTDLVAGPVCE